MPAANAVLRSERIGIRPVDVTVGMTVAIFECIFFIFWKLIKYNLWDVILVVMSACNGADNPAPYFRNFTFFQTGLSSIV